MTERLDGNSDISRDSSSRAMYHVRKIANFCDLQSFTAILLEAVGWRREYLTIVSIEKKC
jgi:hypothetical protein